MLKTHTCGELRLKHEGMQVVLCGWIETLRIQGRISFLLLRDRDGLIQVFLNSELTKSYSNLTKESVVRIKGIVKKRPSNQIKNNLVTGEVEVESKSLEVLSKSETPLPINMDKLTTTNLDKRLDFRFLDLRRENIQPIFKIRSKIFKFTVNFFEEEGFIAIQTSKLTGSGVESGAEEFKIPYFKKKAALTQSPQVYKQMFVASGLEKVYEIGPVFRAEKSHTTRHLTEFTGIDLEMGFIKDEHDVMNVVERYILNLLSYVKRNCKEELKILGVVVNVPKEIPRIDIKEAKELLRLNQKIVSEDDDLDAEAEKILGNIIQKKYDSSLVFVLNYPWKKRPFYHMKPKDNPNGTKSFDLIFNGIEIATGAQREHRLNILENQAKEKGINLKEMDFYRNIFRFGCPPHGGIGMGLDRITEQLLGLKNIREAILLPRDPERITP